MLKHIVAATAAMSLTAAPAIAQSSASALSVQSSHQRAAAAEGEGNELVGAPGWVVPGIAAVLVILAILALTETWPFEGSTSP